MNAQDKKSTHAPEIETPQRRLSDPMERFPSPVQPVEARETVLFSEIKFVESKRFTALAEIYISHAEKWVLFESIVTNRLAVNVLESASGIKYCEVVFLAHQVLFVDMRDMGEMLMVDIRPNDGGSPTPLPPKVDGLNIKTVLKKLCWIVIGGLLRKYSSNTDAQNSTNALMPSSGIELTAPSYNPNMVIYDAWINSQQLRILSKVVTEFENSQIKIAGNSLCIFHEGNSLNRGLRSDNEYKSSFARRIARVLDAIDPLYVPWVRRPNASSVSSFGCKAGLLWLVTSVFRVRGASDSVDDWDQSWIDTARPYLGSSTFSKVRKLGTPDDMMPFVTLHLHGGRYYYLPNAMEIGSLPAGDGGLRFTRFSMYDASSAKFGSASGDYGIQGDKYEK